MPVYVIRRAICAARRGGQRSHIVQQWLHEAGIEYPLIVGGYKALRQAHISSEEAGPTPDSADRRLYRQQQDPLVCSRPDGIDLEGLAHHRGSSFSRTCVTNTPRQHLKTIWRYDVEKTGQHRRWVLEDEGHMIGANHLPECMRERMAQSPLAVVEDRLRSAWSACGRVF